MAHMINQMINLSYIFTVNSMDVIHSTCKYFEIINESASLKIMLYVFLTCAAMPFLSCILLHRIKWIFAANHFGICNQSICSLQFQYKERYLAGYISQNVLYGFAYMYLQLHKKSNNKIWDTTWLWKGSSGFWKIEIWFFWSDDNIQIWWRDTRAKSELTGNRQDAVSATLRS